MTLLARLGSSLI